MKLIAALAVVIVATQAGPAPAPRSIDMPAVFRPSPDGGLIAFEHSGDLLVRAMAGGVPRRLVSHTDAEWVRSFVWSRDGRQIAYALCNRAVDAIGPPTASVRCSSCRARCLARATVS